VICINQSHSLDALRRTSAEVMAAAILELFPNAQLIGGGQTIVGFYYDFHFPFSFKNEFLTLIEERIRLIVKEKRPIKILEMMPENAGALLAHKGQNTRAEAVRAQRDLLVSMFQMGEFVDYGHPPYLSDAGDAAVFKVTEFSEEEHEELGSFTRFYGTAFFDSVDLKKFIKSGQSLKFKDHVQWGKQLDLFSPCREIGPGLWRWHPKGESLRHILLNLWKEESSKQNFQFISTPRHYKRHYCPISEIAASHIQTFISISSRADLPVRLAECAYVQPPESDPLLNGMISSLAYFRDQEHIFCSEEQLLEECISSLQFILKNSKILSFEEYQLALCSRGANHKKAHPSWKKSERLLIQALRHSQLEYIVDDKTEVLNGPRIEVRIKDILGREWTGPFVGIDCVHPSLWGLQHAVVVRSMFGSLERILALMIERSEGILPFWLAPEQVRVIAVNEQLAGYANDLSGTLESLGIRVKVDRGKDKLSKRMYDALCEKVPYAVVVGKQEQQLKTAAVRAYNSNETESMSLEALIQKLTCLVKREVGI
jgi:threonyl-tRNA synthetase